MIRLLLIICISSLSGCAVYEDMSPLEKAWQMANIIDIAQTVDGAVLDSSCYYESNPLTSRVIGKHPSLEKLLLWGAGTSMLHAYVGKKLDNSKLPRWTKFAIRSVDLGLKMDTVAHNYSIGVRIGAPNKSCYRQQGRT